ncbi:uncharacterized protein M421DRAFT_318449 [Didymella exigua CBS 183.55]|uniref:Uncharacterized protein n=1 Tax=Didymella exigua CBS 183.55 TaxID=1150837 RepID=A0A6A5RT90_9PLEO|nr:uncharacterized protein M421DRAFT_318449 [Didymella exigua CBS 183.55]KAF1931695.1 hypothetical protein M421DRAFT_318449 [Didymella exigua CBS 183.55]
MMSSAEDGVCVERLMEWTRWYVIEVWTCRGHLMDNGVRGCETGLTQDVCQTRLSDARPRPIDAGAYPARLCLLLCFCFVSRFVCQMSQCKTVASWPLPTSHSCSYVMCSYRMADSSPYTLPSLAFRSQRWSSAVTARSCWKLASRVRPQSRAAAVRRCRWRILNRASL